MEEILKELRDAERNVTTIRNKLRSIEDGFYYNCDIVVFDIREKQTFPNLYIAAETCNYYNGHNGYVELTTNNPEAIHLYNSDSCMVYIVQ